MHMSLETQCQPVTLLPRTFDKDIATDFRGKHVKLEGLQDSLL